MHWTLSYRKFGVKIPIFFVSRITIVDLVQIFIGSTNTQSVQCFISPTKENIFIQFRVQSKTKFYVP